MVPIKNFKWVLGLALLTIAYVWIEVKQMDGNSKLHLRVAVLEKQLLSARLHEKNTANSPLIVAIDKVNMDLKAITKQIQLLEQERQRKIDEEIAMQMTATPTAATQIRTYDGYANYIPQPSADRTTKLPTAIPNLRVDTFEPYTGECAVGDARWNVCNPKSKRPVNRDPAEFSSRVPRQTNWNESTEQFIDRVLRKAWGENPPQIDLYVRAGRGAAYELRILWKTLNLFWPTFLGEIIVVLDYGDDAYVEALLPFDMRHRFHVVYEHVPCQPARIFNQYSYLNLFRHTNADYVVTIDSDCAFHHPVTPDLLFSSSALPILPSSTVFQRGMWTYPLHFFFPDTRKLDEYGHSMVTQPVMFRPSSLKEFRDYVKTRKSVECYEQALVDYMTQVGKSFSSFCWMCQVSLFLAEVDSKEYDLMVTDKRNSSPYIRYASHVTYEHNAGNGTTRERPGASYLPSVEDSTFQSLCRFFGPKVFARECEQAVDFQYLDTLTFKYAGFDLSGHIPQQTKSEHVREMHSRLDGAVLSAIEDVAV